MNDEDEAGQVNLRDAPVDPTFSLWVKEMKERLKDKNRARNRRKRLRQGRVRLKAYLLDKG